MFKTERVPVTLFQSTDEGAPQLTATAGSLKTILKACLVTGYGDKQALGWESAYEDSTYIAFRSKHNKASRCWVSVDSQYERAAVVAGYHEMTAKNTGEKKFGEGLMKLMAYSVQSARWTLVGHGRGFCLLVLASNGGGDNYERCCQVLYFGDFNSLAPADDRNCVMIKSGHTLTERKYIDNPINGLGNALFNDNNIGKHSFALASSADKMSADISGGIFTAANGFRYAVYPDFVSGGFSAFEMFLQEVSYHSGSQTRHLRGLLGGLLAVREKMPSVGELIFFDNLDDSGDRFVKFNTNDYYHGQECFLLNCTAWEI